MSIETLISLLYPDSVDHRTVFDSFFNEAIARKSLISIQSYKVPYRPGQDSGVTLLPASEEADINAPSIQAMRDHAYKLFEGEYYFEVAVGLPRQVLNIKAIGPNEIEAGWIRAELHLYSSETTPVFNLPSGYDTGLLYAVGNMSYYKQWRMGHQAAHENLMALTEELKVFVDAGAKALVGFDGDRNLDPAQWFLHYQSNWIDYFSKTFQKDISSERFMDVCQNLKTNTYVEMHSSVLLLSSTTLGEFYKAILE